MLTPNLVSNLRTTVRHFYMLAVWAFDTAITIITVITLGPNLLSNVKNTQFDNAAL